MAKVVEEESAVGFAGPFTPPSTLESGRWNGHIFAVSKAMVYSFSDMQIKAASNTKEKTKSKQKYVTRKSAKPVEVTLTVILSINLGCDVRAEAEGFVADAKAGKNDYFYVGYAKLIPAKLMLTDATISDINIAPSGTWTMATAKLTFKQGSKNDSTSASKSKKKTKKSSSSKKSSVKKSSTKTSSSTKKSGSSGSPSSAGDKSSTGKTSSSSSSSHKSLIHDRYVRNQASSAKKTVSTAKKATAAKKSTTTKKSTPSKAPARN